MKLIKYSFAILSLLLSFNSIAGATASIAASNARRIENEFPVLKSTPVDIDTNWIVVDSTFRTKDGYINKCVTERLFGPAICDESKKVSIQAFLENAVGKKYRAVKIEPHFDKSGSYVFLVIYYKLKNQSIS